MVRLGRFLSNMARRDMINAIGENGECLVIERILAGRQSVGDVVVLDVGANVGEWTLALLGRISTRDRTPRVYAFEPAAGTRSILMARLEEKGYLSDVTIVPSALSDKRGIRSMFIVEDGAGTNSLHSDGNSNARTEEVSADTLDHFCEKEGIEHIAMVKIDTEGHDFAVLRGARRMLERKGIAAVQFEYNYRWVFSGRTLFDAFALLGEVNYVVGKVTPAGVEFYEGWHPELETFREGNYLACPREEMARFPRLRWWNE